MNPFRQLLKMSSHQAPLGTLVMSASPLVAEAIGWAGFDWGVLDMEHTPLDQMDLVHMLQAVGNTRMVPVVRVPWNDSVTVKRVLDAGAQTLLFPFVQSAQEAAQAVAATRYPPEGVRGLASISRGSRFGTLADYPRQANKSMGVLVALETPQALQQLEAIAAVPGVDALFFGPGDLSAAMGLPGQPNHARVMAALADAAKRCKAAGKPCGALGATPEALAQYRAMGYDFIALASDLGLLMNAAQGAVKALRMQASRTEHVHTLAGGTQADV
jgi:2-keto-3-deoxy-L-rhamnonate aldolase RhmA